MLLLTDSISKEDSCWELRLRCGELGELLDQDRGVSENGKEALRHSPGTNWERQREEDTWADSLGQVAHIS
jgi:hypothetical protein